MKLDDPLLVRWEYASEERLEKRNAVVRTLSRARVLTANGTLIATSVGVADIAEVWELLGIDEPREQLKFARENGEEALRPHFSDVERHDFDGELVFPDTETLRTFVASTVDRAHLAPQVPEIAEPFRARTQHVIFVARGPR